jgi:hypothetical protein
VVFVPPVQSPGQFVEFSPPAISHVPSPQIGPAPEQSFGQFAAVSPFSHIWLPQTGVAVLPQSIGQCPTSAAAHVPSPQTGMLEDGPSTGGGSSPPPPAHADNTAAKTTAKIDVLIARIKLQLDRQTQRQSYE